MDLELTNRVAMVAAASKGLGRAIAESLAKEGCRLSICSRSQQSLEPARASIANLWWSLETRRLQSLSSIALHDH